VVYNGIITNSGGSATVTIGQIMHPSAPARLGRLMDPAEAQ
jgi:hypothetical protein